MPRRKRKSDANERPNIKIPKSPTSAAVRALKIATGQTDEPRPNRRVIDLTKARKGESTDRFRGR